MEDDHSRDVFCSSMRSHFSCSFHTAVISEGVRQYFDVPVPLSKGYTTFIDCGAYTGDSFKELIERHKCDTYIGFEPDSSNFKILSELCVMIWMSSLEQVYLFPIGTGKK